jgi:hypothetical protein
MTNETNILQIEILQDTISILRDEIKQYEINNEFISNQLSEQSEKFRKDKNKMKQQLQKLRKVLQTKENIIDDLVSTDNKVTLHSQNAEETEFEGSKQASLQTKKIQVEQLEKQLREDVPEDVSAECREYNPFALEDIKMQKKETNKTQELNELREELSRLKNKSKKIKKKWFKNLFT